MIKHNFSFNMNRIGLFAFLLSALASASLTVTGSQKQSTIGSTDIAANAPKGQQLWKFETGG